MKTVIAVEKSADRKLSPRREVSATYAAQVSCPVDCPFLNRGCYGEEGHTGMHTRRLNEAADALGATHLDVARDEHNAIVKLSGKRPLRLHVVGDCRSDVAASLVSMAAEAHMEKHGQPAWTYNHAWRVVKRESWGKVSVLASTERPSDARIAMDKGYAAALVVPEFSGHRRYNLDGIPVIPCPAQTGEATCLSCGMCMDADRLLRHGVAIGFAAHSARTARVQSIVRMLNDATEEVEA